MTKPTGWTNPQKSLMAMACRDAGIDESERRFILRQLGGHAIVDGEPTAKSPRLTNEDFEKFMASVESYANSKGRRLLGKGFGYWENQFINGDLGRLLHKAQELQHALIDAGVSPGGAIAKAVGRDYGTLHDLDRDELNKAINAMTAISRRKGAA